MKNYIGVSLPKNLIETIDPIIKSRGFTSRSEYLKHLIRKDMEKVISWVNMITGV